MPVHPVMAGKFHLLEGVSSIPELFENPALADRRQAFEDHGGFVPPTVATRMDEAPGPHGPTATPSRAWRRWRACARCSS